MDDFLAEVNANGYMESEPDILTSDKDTLSENPKTGLTTITEATNVRLSGAKAGSACKCSI